MSEVVTKPKIGIRRKIFLAIIIGSFSLDTFTNVLVITVAPYMQEALQVSVLSIGVLLSSFPLGVALGHLLFGNLVNRYGVTVVFISGPLLIVATSCSSYLFSNSINLLTVLFFIQALGVAAVCLAARVILYQLADGDINRLARYYSLQYCSFLVSEAFAPLIVTYLLLFSVWQNVYLCSASLAGFFVVVSWRFVYEHPLLATKALGTKTAKLFNVFRNRKFLAYTLVGILTYIWIYIYYVGLPYSLKFIFMISTEFYGLIIFLNLISGLLATVCNYYLLRYFHAQVLTLVSCLASFVFALICLLAAVFSYQLFFIYNACFIAMSFTIMIALTNASAVALEHCSRSTVGKASGFFGFAGYLSGFFSSLVTGGLLSIFPDDIIVLILWLFFISTALAASSIYAVRID